MYVFAAVLLAYGVVPHQWLTHARQRAELAPGQDPHRPRGRRPGPRSSTCPFDITYQVIRDIIVVVIYVVFLGLQIFMWSWWQNRGKKKPALELPTSTYGRPLVKKG